MAPAAETGATHTPRAGAAPAAVCLAAALFAACGGARSAEQEGPEGATIPAVEAVEARTGALPLTERVNGVVKAKDQVSIRPEVEGVVAEVYVRSGDAVQKGQPLVRFRGDTSRDQLQQAAAAVRLEEASAREARARVQELRAQVVRTRELSDEQLVSRVQLETEEARLAAAQAAADQAEARVQQARATEQERRTALDKTLVRSPVQGRVGQRLVEPGMLANPGAILFEVGNLDTLRVEIPLTDEMLGYVKEGHPVLVRQAPGVPPIRGRLSRISPFLAAGSFSTTGEIDLENPGDRLRPGMFVTVDVLYGESETATLVPTSALWEDPRTGVRSVFVLAKGPAPGPELSEAPRPVERRPVEVKADGRGSVGIAGVEPGEWVVTVGQHLLARDGGTRARVRSTTWEVVEGLQDLQREDLMRQFLEKQERVARTLGAAPPTTEEIRSAAARPGASPSPSPRD